MTASEALETLVIFKWIGLGIIALVALIGVIAIVHTACITRRKNK